MITIREDTPLRRSVDSRVGELIAWARKALPADELIIEPWPQGRERWRLEMAEQQGGTTRSTGAQRSYTAADLLELAEPTHMADLFELEIRQDVRRAFGPDGEGRILASRELVKRWWVPKGVSPWTPDVDPGVPSMGAWRVAWWAWWRLAIEATRRGKKPPPDLSPVRDADGRIIPPWLASWSPKTIDTRALAAWAKEHGHGDLAEAAAAFVPNVAVLYEAERQENEWAPRPFEAAPLVANEVGVGALAHLEAPGRSHYLNNAVPGDDDSHIIVTWQEPGKPAAQLSLDFGLGYGVFDMLQKHAGPQAVAHALTVMVMAWAQRAHVSQDVWVYPREVLAMRGLSASRDNLARWWRMMDMLASIQLSVRVKGDSRGPFKAPLCRLTGLETRSGKAPAKIQWHPALFETITGHDGRPGSSWVAAGVGLFELSPGRGEDSVHLTALATGRQFNSRRMSLRRTQSHFTAEDLAVGVKVSRLLKYAGREPETMNRRQQKQARASVERSVERLHDVGFYGSVEWTSDRGPVDAALRLTPGARTLEAFNGRYPVRPAFVPSTGSELRLLLDETGRTADDLARELGGNVTPAAIWQVCRRYRSMPLTDGWRKRLADWRWQQDT